MRFIGRSLIGLFLMAMTVGLLALAADLGWRALQARLEGPQGARRAAEREFAVNTTRVTAGRLAPVLEVHGEIRARRSLEIRATASGRVIWLSDAFEEGGRVAAGDLLLRIDPQEAESARQVARTDLAEAEAEIRDADRALALARDDLATATEQSDLREQALARQKNARQRGVGTDTTVEEAELSASSARQAVVAKRQALAAAEARVALAATGRDRQRIALAEAERALAETEMRAAFSGTLTGVTLVEGRLVADNESLGQLVDPDRLEVAFRLSASEYARLLDDQGRLLPAAVTVSLGVDGIDLSAPGRILRESAMVGEGQTGRQIFAALDSPRGLVPGDFVAVRIEEQPLDGVAMLPATAIGADGTVLAVTADSRLERLTVEPLRRQGDNVILRPGAAADRDVVAELTPLLGAGIKVRPVTEAMPTLAAADPAPEMIALTDERRARLTAFVEASTRMPPDARQRLLDQLAEPMVPAALVARLEARIGG